MAEVISRLAQRVRELACRPLRIMEVCGTHTHAIFRHGLKAILPSHLTLLSGPGCPVCVTSQRDIDAFITLAQFPDTIVATFGDMVRVPGSRGSLAHVRSQGAVVEVVYSPGDALRIAQENPGKRVVFLAVGFETTAPLVAAVAMQAKDDGVRNLFIASALKTMVPALESLLVGEGGSLDGLLLPGHVSTIIGAKAYEPLAQRFRIPMAVTGFEPHEILYGILTVVDMAMRGKWGVVNCYPRAVSWRGNRRAQDLISKVFRPTDVWWRGLGPIAGSGLSLSSSYSYMDALVHLSGWALDADDGSDGPTGCRCGDVLVGRLSPPECPLFLTSCRPDHPVGPCMVSSEGSCAAYALWDGQVQDCQIGEVRS